MRGAIDPLTVKLVIPPAGNGSQARAPLTGRPCRVLGRPRKRDFFKNRTSRLLKTQKPKTRQMFARSLARAHLCSGSAPRTTAGPLTFRRFRLYDQQMRIEGRTANSHLPLVRGQSHMDSRAQLFNPPPPGGEVEPPQRVSAMAVRVGVLQHLYWSLTP
jgi:hypothetical protein